LGGGDRPVDRSLAVLGWRGWGVGRRGGGSERAQALAALHAQTEHGPTEHTLAARRRRRSACGLCALSISSLFRVILFRTHTTHDSRARVEKCDMKFNSDFDNDIRKYTSFLTREVLQVETASESCFASRRPTRPDDHRTRHGRGRRSTPHTRSPRDARGRSGVWAYIVQYSGSMSGPGRDSYETRVVQKVEHSSRDATRAVWYLHVWQSHRRTVRRVPSGDGQRHTTRPDHTP
jgi:hypothetical protein